MQPTALHPFDPAIAVDFVQSLGGVPTPDLPGHIALRARESYQLARSGQERGLHELTATFSEIVATQHPSFAHEGLSLTAWEAQVDRGAGMLMRPPSRMLIEAGLDPALARQLPIRLDTSLGMMGGAYVPPQLVPQLGLLLESKFDRLVKRLVAAELDPLPFMGLMIEAVQYAEQNGLGIYESLGVVAEEIPLPGARIVTFDRKSMAPALRKRIEEAAKPEKEPGRISRLLGRAKSPDDSLPPKNGHIHIDE